MVSARLRVLRTWVKAVATNTRLRHKAEKAWEKAKEQASGRDRWRRVKGPITATIATLEDFGWMGRRPLQWEDHRGQGWVAAGGDTRQLEAQITNKLRQISGNKLPKTTKAEDSKEEVTWIKQSS